MDRICTMFNIPVTKNGKMFMLGKLGMLKLEELKKDYDNVAYQIADCKKMHNVAMYNANIVFYGEIREEKKQVRTTSKTKAMQIVRNRTIADVLNRVKLNKAGDSITVPCNFTKKQVEWFVKNGMIVKTEKKGYSTIINTMGHQIRYAYK